MGGVMLGLVVIALGVLLVGTPVRPWAPRGRRGTGPGAEPDPGAVHSSG